MKIILIALLIGSVTGVGFLIYDKVIINKKLNADKKIDDKEISRLIDYSTYQLNNKERVGYFFIAAICLFIIGYIFYQNIIISSILALFAIFYQRVKVKQLINKRKDDLRLEFKQALYSLATSLAAGKSVENAFKDVITDLELIYPSGNANIITEFTIINRRFENGEPIENALIDFSERADIEDITNFTDVFVTCKRTGGDLVEVIRKTSNTISKKIETQQEIMVLIAQKRLEAKILSIAPFVIIALISFSSPDYMQPLYEPGIGPIVMTIALIVLISSYLISKKIMNIKV